MYLQKCDNFAIIMRIYLHKIEIQQRAINVLSALDVYAEYEYIHSALKKAAELKIQVINSLNQSLQIVTCYDNFEFAEKTDKS